MTTTEQDVTFAAQFGWASDALKQAGLCPQAGMMFWLLGWGHNRMSWSRRRLIGRKIRQGKLTRPHRPTAEELAPFMERNRKALANRNVD